MSTKTILVLWILRISRYKKALSIVYQILKLFSENIITTNINYTHKVEYCLGQQFATSFVSSYRLFALFEICFLSVLYSVYNRFRGERTRVQSNGTTWVLSWTTLHRNYFSSARWHFTSVHYRVWYVWKYSWTWGGLFGSNWYKSKRSVTSFGLCQLVFH